EAAVNSAKLVAKSLVRALGVLVAFVIVMPSSAQPTTRRVARANPRERQQQTIGFHAPTSAPRQFAEDFDRDVTWDQKENRGAAPRLDYGYSSANHLAAAGCAPGEIGGTVCGAGISWFADSVSNGSVALNADMPLTASGWCTFTSMDGNAAVGWFDADRYAAPDTAPH